MRELKIGEMSTVDFGAQEGARILLMKRRDSSDAENSETGDENLDDVLPSSDDRRRVDITAKTSGLKGSTSNAAILAGTRTPANAGEPADDLGNQPTGVSDMAEQNAGDLSADLKKRDAEIARLNSIIDLTPEHRAHHDALPVAKRGGFLAKTDADKDAEIEAVEKANPVIYTDKKGREYRKNDDRRLVEIAKERDEDAEAMAKFRVEAEHVKIEKQADALLSLVPGERVHKMALVRQVNAIEDAETRTAVEKMLEGANKVYKMAMSTQGITETRSSVDSPDSAEQLLKAAVEACAKEDGIAEHKAYSKVLSTPKGAQLYDMTRRERIRGSSN